MGYVQDKKLGYFLLLFFHNAKFCDIVYLNTYNPSLGHPMRTAHVIFSLIRCSVGLAKFCALVGLLLIIQLSSKPSCLNLFSTSLIKMQSMWA